MIEAVAPTEVERLLKESPGAITLLDVREDDERATARIEPSLHIPMNEVVARLAEIPTDRRVVVYCHHGTRSMMVATYLASHGVPNVANLTGGIDGWSREVDPDVPRY